MLGSAEAHALIGVLALVSPPGRESSDEEALMHGRCERTLSVDVEALMHGRPEVARSHGVLPGTGSTFNHLWEPADHWHIFCFSKPTKLADSSMARECTSRRCCVQRDGGRTPCFAAQGTGLHPLARTGSARGRNPQFVPGLPQKVLATVSKLPGHSPDRHLATVQW